MSRTPADLRSASESGDVNVVTRHLQERPQDLNSEDDSKYTALMKAAEKGHLEVVNALLQAGADREKGKTGGDTALMLAAEKGHLGVVNALLQAGADKDKGDVYRRTALMLAAWKGHLEVVNALVQAGANRDQAEREGVTALMWAAENGHLGVVNALVWAGADKEKRTDYKRNTALMRAAERGHLEVVKALLRAGADRETSNHIGYTALQLAANNGHLEVVKALKEVMADKKKDPPPSPVPLPPRPPSTTGTTAPQQPALPAPPPVTPAGSAPIPAASAAKATPPTPLANPDLASQCAQLLQEAALAPTRSDLMQRRDLLQAQYDAADAADEDFNLIAELGTQLQALQLESAQLPLTEEACLTLADRLAQLVQQVTDRCKELAKARDFAAVTALGTQLTALRAVVLPAVVRGATPRFPPDNGPTLLVDNSADVKRYQQQCAALLKQVADAPARQRLMHRMQELQTQYDAAEAAAVDFVLVGTLGFAVDALREESAKLPLSEEAYLTLADRHAQLLQQLTDKCKELKAAKDFAGLGALATSLGELKALNVSALLPVLDDSALDPVLPVLRN